MSMTKRYLDEIEENKTAVVLKEIIRDHPAEDRMRQALLDGQLSYEQLINLAASAMEIVLSAQAAINRNSENYEQALQQAFQSFKTNRAKNAAAAMLKKSLTQTEKRFVLECWQDWQSGKLQYESKAAFAREMLDKCEKLKNTKTIEDWCRKWEKEHSSS